MAGTDPDHVPSSIGAGKFERSIRRIRPILTKLHHISAFYETQKFFSTFKLNGGGPYKVCAQFHLCCRRFNNGLERVAEAYGPQSTSILDKFVTIRIPHPTSLTLDNIGCHG